MIVDPKFTDKILTLCKPQTIQKYFNSSSTKQVIIWTQFHPNLLEFFFIVNQLQEEKMMKVFFIQIFNTFIEF